MKWKAQLTMFLLGLGLAASAQTLDEEFGAEGVVVIEAASNGLYPQSILIDDATLNINVLVQSCDININCTQEVYVHSVSQSGELNMQFGEQGVATIPFTEPYRSSKLIASQNWIYVLSYSDLANSGELVQIAKLTTSGFVDSTFAANGILDVSSIVADASFTSEFILDEPGLYMVGAANSDQRILCKILPTGVVDTTFGVGGIQEFEGMFRPTDQCISFHNQNEFVVLSVLDSSGLEGYNSVYTAERFDMQGNYKSDFGTGGTARSDTISNSFVQHPITIFSAERGAGYIYVSGNSRFYDVETQQEWHSAIARFNVDGTVDFDYGQNGIIPNPTWGSANITAVPQGGLITYGREGLNQGFVINRYNNAGVLDSDFGNGGSLYTEVGDYEAVFAQGGILQQDGKLVAYGVGTTSDSTYNTVIVRYRQGITDMAELSGGTDYNIFPNPTRNTLHLPQELSTQNLRLYNSQGQQFEVVQLSTDQLDVSHLAPGMYVLQAGERVWRFVKE